jgi:uncharacterized protein YecE (DUF72 family)
MPNPTCHIGTSGWSYQHWAKGRFYPKGLKQGDWLRFLADHFDTVEINSSFYRLPQDAMITRWRGQVPARFKFAVKLWRMITHQKKLTDCRDQLERFLAAVVKLSPKRGPLLVQLPPSLHKDVPRLDSFLDDLKVASGRSRWKIAVEFRHESWLSDDVYALLDRHRASLVLADMERCPITEPNDAGFVYVRRHGPAGRYQGRYTTRHLEADADRIVGWLDAGKSVYVYFNNDVAGHAVDNARELKSLLQPR